MDLASQLAFLDSLLLADVTTEFPDPLSDTEKASVGAYMVLSHACIEEFLEDVFLNHYSRLEELARLPMVPREVAGMLLAIGQHLPEKKRPSYKSRTITGIAVAGKVHYEAAVIRGNHGIKTENVRKLANGVGLVWNEFEATLANELADLDTLGANRGEAGHLSPFSTKAVALTRQVYPDEVRGWVESGCAAAFAIERYLKAAVQEQMNCLVTFGMEVD